MSNLKHYEGFSLDAAVDDTKRAEALSGSHYMKLEVDENVLRFAPLLPGQKSPFRISAIHYVDGPPGTDDKIVFACPRVELKEPCPACAEASECAQSPDPNVRKRGKDLEPTMRVFANVLDRSNPDAGYRVLAFGKKILNGLKKLRKSARSGGDFTDPTEKGFDVIITREGTGRYDTDYDVAPDRSNSPIVKTQAEFDQLELTRRNLEAEIVPVVPDELHALLAHHRAAPAVQPVSAQRQIGSAFARQASVSAAQNTVHTPADPDPFDDDVPF